MKNTKTVFVLTLVAAAATMVAHAQTPVFVPGNASGFFGNPADQQNPMVSAITVTGPGNITVTYVSGKVTDSFPKETGPDGVTCNSGCAQLPLLEAQGVFPSGAKYHLDALIGVFVPASRANQSGFTAVDGTKGVVPVGIMPNGLFFIGKGKTFPVTQAGTLYLGINDNWVSDNGGGFNVDVSVQ